MKRFLSILLAIAMLLSLAPMAFAAEEPEFDVQEPGSTEGDDFDVGFGELVDPIPGATAETPIIINQSDWEIVEMGVTAPISMTYTAEIPVGATRYFYVGGYIAEYVLTAGEEAIELTGDPRQGYTFSFTNNDAENTAVVIGAALPLGSLGNPEVIDELAYTYTEVAVAAGDSDGYYYTYTAPADGLVTLYFANVPEETVEEPTYGEDGEELTPAVIEKYTCDIVVTKGYTTVTLLQDGVDNYGLELQIPVVAGDELTIQVLAVQDLEGNYYPEAEMTWVGNFTYPAGSEQNPITIEWVWNDEYTTATATATVPEGATQYFTGNAGMILTVDGEVVEMDEMGVFALTDGTHELVLSTPVGAFNNPEVIENIDGYTDTNSLEADGEYYYIWTATEDGTVTLDVTDGANITVDKLTYTEDSEWPISEQFELAEATTDENYNYTGWNVAENLAIEVVAGQQLKIQVNALTDWSTWSTPAIEYTLTGEFAPAGPIDVSDTMKFVTKALTFQEDIGIQLILRNTAVAGYDSFRVECVHQDPKNGTQTEDMTYVPMGNNYKYTKFMLPVSMPDTVTFTIYAEKDGQEYIGESYTTSIEAMTLDKLASYSNNANARRVLVDMLNYGAAAQVAFNHNPSVLPNTNLGQYAADATQEDPIVTEMKEIGTPGSVTVQTFGLSLQSRAEFQLILRNCTENCELRAYVNGVEYAKVPYSDFIDRGTMKQAKLAVKAADYRTVMQIAVYDTTTGEAVSAVYTTSIEGYGAGLLSHATNGPLVLAMMKYGDAVANL